MKDEHKGEETEARSGKKQTDGGEMKRGGERKEGAERRRKQGGEER